jgi:hypothetical protein
MLKRAITFGLFLLLATGTPALAKPWRKITPLRSNARDVAKLWRECEKAETRCQFTFEDQEVMIVFSGSKIGALECERVPNRTVLAVIVKFSRPKKLQEFQSKNKTFEVFDPSSPPKRGYKTYYYVKDGFMINTYKGQVVGLVFIAAQKDIHLCPEYYQDPKAFVEVGLDSLAVK